MISLAQAEIDILDEIKQKMDHIKANQRKMQPKATVPLSHFDGDDYILN